MILAPKDIGFYFQGRHYGMEDVGDVGSIPDAAKRALRGDRSLREIKHIGAFVVYENPGYNGA